MSKIIKTSKSTFQFRPHPSQLQVMQARKRFKVIACGRRWGKTTLAVYQLILEAISNKKGGEYWYLAPTYRQAKSIAWRMLKNIWTSLPPQLQTDKNEAELWVEVGRSRISLKGADNEDSLRGSGLSGVIFDEVASYKHWSYLWEDVIRPALSDYHGFAWFISTPKGFNHFYDLYNEQDMDGDFVSFHFTSYENPFLDPEEIEKAKVQLTDDSFAQEYLADFRKYTGLIYKEFDRAVHVIDPFDLPNFWQFFRTMDFGAVNPTVCLWIAVDNVDNVYIYDEYYHSGQTSIFHADVIKAKSGKMNFSATWGDPSAEQQMLDYAMQQIPIAPALKTIEGEQKGWVRSGIEKVRELLKPHPQTGRPRLFVFRNCVNTIREFEGYHWLEDRGDINAKEMPEKTDDHCMDALRYFVVSFAPAARTDQERETIVLPTNPYTGY